MEKLVAYKRMPLWTKETMPEAVQQKHNTKVGTWGKITVLKGTLKFIELTEDAINLRVPFKTVILPQVPTLVLCFC